MSQRLKRGVVQPTYPHWMRVLAMLCLLLVGGASTAQAAHVHGRWLPQNAAKVGVPSNAAQLPGGEERCQLCQAMHSALPASLRVEPVRLTLVVCKPTEQADRLAESQWHFAMFSRPPPLGQGL